MTRAITPEDVVERVSRWNMGIGPSDLAEALGWTQAELENYHETGNLPEAAPKIPADVNLELRPGPLRTTPEDYVDTTPWLSRWRIQPDGSGGWFVRDKDANRCPAPTDFGDDWGKAQARADELNRIEQYAIIAEPN